MSDLRKAAEQALEALEEIALAGMSVAPEMLDDKEAFHARQAWRFIGIAARALEPVKKALAEQPEQGPVAHPFEDKSVISALSWAAGLIEQAYRACGGHNGADSWLMNYADKQGERIRQADHREWEKVNGRWRVKATTPSSPQREWVGLTNEEIDYLYVEHRGDGGPTAICEQFAKAYEACLKEKNT